MSIEESTINLGLNMRNDFLLSIILLHRLLQKPVSDHTKCTKWSFLNCLTSVRYFPIQNVFMAFYVIEISKPDIEASPKFRAKLSS